MSDRDHGSGMERWWDEGGVGKKVAMAIMFGILGIGLLSLVGLVAMSLWNSLMPEIFGVKTVSYWQMWGLMLLSFILFKNWGSGDSGRRRDRKRKRHLRRYMETDSTPTGGSEAEGPPEDSRVPPGDPAQA